MLTHVILAPGAYRGGPDGPVPYPFPGPSSRDFTRVHATSREFTRVHANSRRHDVFAREGLQKLKICSSCSVGSTLFSCFSCSVGSTFSCFCNTSAVKRSKKKHAFYVRGVVKCEKVLAMLGKNDIFLCFSCSVRSTFLKSI